MGGLGQQSTTMPMPSFTYVNAYACSHVCRHYFKHAYVHVYMRKLKDIWTLGNIQAHKSANAMTTLFGTPSTASPAKADDNVEVLLV